MKILKYLTVICFFSFFIISCGTDTTANVDGDSNAATHQHDGHDHSGHNHDHAGHDHSGHNHDHAGHDHSGHNHDHAGHDHSGHSHSTTAKSNKTFDMKAKNNKKDQEAFQNKILEAQKNPATDAQKHTANTICNCMKKQKIFNAVVNTKSQTAFNKAAGDNNLDAVKAMQNCHNTILPATIKNMGDNAAIYAYKTREVVNQECLGGNKNLWFLIAAYIKNNPKTKGMEHLQPERKVNSNQ